MSHPLSSTPLLRGEPAILRQRLESYFLEVYDRYESLFTLLSCDEAYFIKPIALRHPLIFYFGHTATFFINKLILAGLIPQRIDPKLEAICAVGVDEMSWDDLNEAHYTWPSVEEVKHYRLKVKEVVCEVIRHAPCRDEITWDDPLWAVMMGIEHELIHLETSSVLIRQHDLHYLTPQPQWEPTAPTYGWVTNELVTFEGEAITLGKPYDDSTYGWDNEYGQHTAFVSPFAAGRYLVSNGEFLPFVKEGGYSNPDLWDDEGWRWVTFSQATCPTFWIPDQDGYHLRLLASIIPLPLDWPVEVNALEAAAFCRWKTLMTGEPYRLPTEDEYALMYIHSDLDTPANHALHFTSPTPVTEHPQGALYDVRGNVWQWTQTPIYPFEGFRVHRLYDDFTTPTYDDRHAIIKGGSWISCGNEITPTSRYAFRRHFFQHAGFRYVVADAPLIVATIPYENDPTLARSIASHYSDTHFGVPNFPKAIAQVACEAMQGRPFEKALDLGCAAGRTTLELAKNCPDVTGVDFSARFVSLGVTLTTQGVLRYTLPDEGELLSYNEVLLSSVIDPAFVSRVSFIQGDACNLKPLLTNYDLIVAADLIEYLYNPRKLLTSIHERIRLGGCLVLASSYLWDQDRTPRQEWIGGFKRHGESWHTLDGLKEVLSPHFRLIQSPRDLPCVRQETTRHYSYTLHQVTLWERIV